MEREELFEIVDAILNKATDADVEVIIEALKRRGQRSGSGTYRGVDPGRLAKESAKTISSQMSYSVDGIRKMIQNFAVDVIRKEAPELSEEQISELLEAWVPDPGKGPKQPDLPPDILLTMIKQFLAYSTGTMPASEQMELEHQIPDWQRKYWEKMPSGIRSVLSLFLKGKIDSETCWEKIYSDLGLE